MPELSSPTYSVIEHKTTPNWTMEWVRTAGVEWILDFETKTKRKRKKKTKLLLAKKEL